MLLSPCISSGFHGHCSLLHLKKSKSCSCNFLVEPVDGPMVQQRWLYNLELIFIFVKQFVKSLNYKFLTLFCK